MSSQHKTSNGKRNEGSTEPLHPLNVKDLTERCMGNTTIALVLLDKFESQLRRDIVEIEQRLVAQDAAQIASMAHALKGAAGAVAAPALHSVAAALEAQARQGDLQSAAREVLGLRTEVERCLLFLPAARGTLASTAGNTRARNED